MSACNVNANPHLIRDLVVDDTPHVHRELRALLQLTSGVEVVREAADGARAVAQAERLRPDVIVMDLEMPGMDGIATTREIKRRGLAERILILSLGTAAAMACMPAPSAYPHFNGTSSWR